jgi:alpha-glucosidase
MSDPVFTPFPGLKPLKASGTSVSLAGSNALLKLSFLSPDLFRLRATSKSAFSKRPSWAVEKPAWPDIHVDVSCRSKRLRMSSTSGTFDLCLLTGEWQLRDKNNLELFAAKPAAMGFAGPEPCLTLSLNEGEAVFGLGETTGPMNKRGLIREFWNVDVRGHTPVMHAGLRNMYLSIPFAISLRDGRAAGIFWDNPGRQLWDIGQTQFDRWQMKAASGEIDVYFFLGPFCGEILERYTELTGRMPLPPLWGLGYHQCRYSYESRARVEEVARTFRGKQIPCDAIYLDIHHMDEHRVFTFGPSFPKAAKMAAQLSDIGFKLVAIVDPGVKDDPAFPVLQRGRALGAFIKAPGGKGDYIGQVWPGAVRFPDFLNAKTRRWWGTEQAVFQQIGIAGFWNDMNEPADFSGKKKELPGNCWHSSDCGRLRHADVHNAYGLQMARASYEGALEHQPLRRPFTITRAGYAGVQRYAVVWTGDNHSSWEHLADSVQMLLNLSLSGVPFCGADAGGFIDNTTGELMARWIQLAAFTPFFRNHSNIGTIDQEPWAFGPKIEEICKRHIELRYALLPYFYALLVQAHRHGTPVIRPMFWQFQNDPDAVAASDQFMLGADLLVAPILRQGAKARSVYLPAGIWFDFWTGEELRGGKHVVAVTGLETLPLFVRAGAMLPMIPVQQYTSEKEPETVTLHIWPGSGTELNWYEDDGVSLDCSAGAFHERRIALGTARRSRVLRFATSVGNYGSRVKTWRIALRCAAGPVKVKVDRRVVASTYDPELALCSFSVSNAPSELEAVWR